MKKTEKRIKLKLKNPFSLFIIFLIFINFFISQKIIYFLNLKLRDYDAVIFNNSLTETLGVIFLVDIYLTVVILLPILLILFLKRFSDAFYSNERYFLISLIKSLIFGYIGAIFGYYITINYVIPILFNYNSILGMNNFANITFLISFVVNNMLLFFFIFQIPLVIKSLLKFEITSKKTLNNIKKQIYIVFLILCSLLTPAEPVSTLVLVLPAIILYEFSIHFF